MHWKRQSQESIVNRFLSLLSAPYSHSNRTCATRREDGAALTEGAAEDEGAEEDEGPAAASAGAGVFFVVGAFAFKGDGAFFCFALTSAFFSSAVGGVDTLATASATTSSSFWGCCCCCCFSGAATPRRFLRVVEASGVAGEAGSGRVVAVAVVAAAASVSFFVLLDDGLVTVVHSLVLAGMAREAWGEGERERETRASMILSKLLKEFFSPFRVWKKVKRMEGVFLLSLLRTSKKKSGARCFPPPNSFPLLSASPLSIL